MRRLSYKQNGIYVTTALFVTYIELCRHEREIVRLVSELLESEDAPTMDVINNQEKVAVCCHKLGADFADQKE